MLYMFTVQIWDGILLEGTKVDNLVMRKPDLLHWIPKYAER